MEYFTREKLVMRILSENSRATVSEVARVANCSRVTASKLIDKLARELDIRFTLELDLTRVGYLQRHIMVFKFAKKPSIDAIIERVGGEKFVLAAYVTEGNYDLILYVAASDPVEYLWREAVIAEKFGEYSPTMKPSSIPFMSFGYMPFDNTLISEIGKNTEVDKLDIEILKMLNVNSRIGCRKIAKALKVNENTVRYRLFNFKKNGVIKRFTIAVQKVPYDYIFTFFENFRFGKDFEQRSAAARSGFWTIDKELPLMSTFQLTAPITGSYGFFAMALFNSKEEAMKNVVRRHKIAYGKEEIEIKYARLVKVAKGLLPFRNLDVSKGFIAIKWE